MKTDWRFRLCIKFCRQEASPKHETYRDESIRPMATNGKEKRHPRIKAIRKLFSSTHAPKTPLSTHVKQGESGLFPSYSGGMFTFGYAQSLAKMVKSALSPTSRRK